MRYTQKHPQHTYTKRDVYYFSRVIPSDLRNHFTKPRIIQGLKTKSALRAAVASKMLSAKLDDCWLGLRLKQVDVPASHLLISGATVNLESNLPTIDEALETYLTVKGTSTSTILATIRMTQAAREYSCSEKSMRGRGESLVIRYCYCICMDPLKVGLQKANYQA